MEQQKKKTYERAEVEKPWLRPLDVSITFVAAFWKWVQILGFF